MDRFLNRVQIAGAVYRPGIYALEENMTVKSLIDKADGIQDDAFLSRAIIIREKDDKTKELLSFSIEQLIDGKIQDIPLKKEDSIYIASVSSMKEEQKVSIWGEVQNEGDYSFRENMTLKDLVFIAGGLREHAELKEVEVSRVIKNSDLLKASNERAKSYTFSIDRGLSFEDGAGEFKLEPLDHVIIRPISGLEIAKRVKIEGEVYYPGSYILTAKNERISSVIKRAGGLNQYAFVDGAILFRKQAATETEKKLDDMLYNSITEEENSSIKKDSFLTDEGIVGIDLKKIMENPGTKWDLIMEEGDVISIPRQLQTVQVSGEVFLPTYVRYDESMSFSDYIDNAGGFSSNAFKRKVYVIHANGMAGSTKNVLFFFKKYPKIKPGSHIYIPAKPERKGKMTTAETISLTNSSISLAAIVMSLIKTVF